MSARAALAAALRDVLRNWWRLVPLNAAVGTALLGIAAAATLARAALVLLVLIGPLLAALAHCAVELVASGETGLRDGLVGLRRHWRRGLALGTPLLLASALGLYAVAFYAGGAPALWPLSFLALYVVAVFALYQLLLWIVVAAEPELPLRETLARAGGLLLRAPASSLGLGLALLVVNVAGVAVALAPFLTVTIVYSFLAAAHFAGEARD